MSLFSRRPLVSVIIPSYNHEAFIEDAITSALDQTVKNIEVIVVDDGSSDGTVARASMINDPRVHITALEANRIQHSRNLALKQAKGRYIAFLNSDDVWEPTKIEAQLADFAANPGLKASFTRVSMIVEDGSFSTETWAEGAFQSENKTPAEWLRFFFETGNDLCISSAVVPRSVFAEVGLFDESLVQISDMDMWVRIANQGEILVNEGALTRMRINKNQNLSAPDEKRNRRLDIELVDVLARFESFRLTEVFFDIIPKPAPSIVVQHAIIARYAWTKYPSLVVFGDRLFANLLKDNLKRQEIVEYFGTEIIHEFLENRTRLEVLVHG